MKRATPLNSFADLNLSTELMQAIEELGYTTPSPIQAGALPILLKNESDFIGQAATGTGKTAAFGIPLIEHCSVKKGAVQGLILCPTRELAIQVSEQIELLGKYKGIHAVAIYGGAGYDKQIQGLKQGLQVVVGTPGRILDHIRRGTLKLGAVKNVILDEADEMISMGFKEDLETILEEIPKGVHTWLFSATMSRQVRSVAEKYLSNPEQVTVNKQEMLSSSVEQVYFPTHESDKPEVLGKIIEAADDFYGIVFCQTKSLVVDLTEYLQKRGFSVDCLHGDMNQAGRERTMTNFRERRIKVLVCTDVASRGLDVKNVTHVVNYSIPREFDIYVHRIGRTARGGSAGIAMSLVTPSQRGLIRRIEELTNARVSEGKIPKRKDIAYKKVSAALAKFDAQEFHARAVESLSETWRERLEGMDKFEIAGRFLSMQYKDLFSERDPAQNEKLRDSRPKMDGRGPPSRSSERAGGSGERSRAASRDGGSRDGARRDSRSGGGSPAAAADRVRRGRDDKRRR